MPSTKNSISKIGKFACLAVCWLLSACQSTPTWLAADSPDHARVWMKVRQNLPFVKVRVNGREQEMLLDTGASECVVTPETVRRLGLQLTHKGVEVRTSAGDSVNLPMTKIPRLEFGGMIYENVDALVHDCARPKQFFPNLEGVLGYSLFIQQQLTLDYPNREIVVSANRPLPRNHPDVVPMRLHVGVPQIPVSVGPTRNYVDVDSGSNGGLELNLSSLAGRILERPRQTGTSYSISTAYKSYSTRVAGSLYIGRVELESPAVELTTGDQRVGGAVLQNMVITLDYSSGQAAVARMF